MAAGGNGAAAGGGTDTKAAFAQIYNTLKAELLADPAFEFTAESHQWIDRVTIPLPPLRPSSFSVVVSWFDPCVALAWGSFLAASPWPIESFAGSVRFQPGSAGSVNFRGTPGS
jgi:hypothetical protein